MRSNRQHGSIGDVASTAAANCLYYKGNQMTKNQMTKIKYKLGPIYQSPVAGAMRQAVLVPLHGGAAAVEKRTQPFTARTQREWRAQVKAFGRARPSEWCQRALKNRHEGRIEKQPF